MKLTLPKTLPQNLTKVSQISVDWLMVYGVWCHIQQYFSYIMAVSFISGENWSMRRKSTTCLKSNIRRSYIPVVCVVRYSYW